MRLLTRLADSGLEVIASHVLTILGGPMERMADWGDKRRRPCVVRFQYSLYHLVGKIGVRGNSAILGSVENYCAIENAQCAFAYYWLA